MLKRQGILGAGSSKNDDGSGYPLGSELLEIVCDLSSHINPPDYPENKDIATAIKEFSQNLQDNFYTSIDTYIARCSEQIDKRQERNAAGTSHSLSDISFSAIGCCLIAEIIKSYGHQKIKWYGNLLPLIFPAADLGDDIDKKIKRIEEWIEDLEIITFNYDLSLEKFIYDNLTNIYFKSNLVGHNSDKIKEIFIKICKKIIHVYGSVVGEDEVWEFVGKDLKDNSMELYFKNKSFLKEQAIIAKDKNRHSEMDQSRSDKYRKQNEVSIKNLITQTINLYNKTGAKNLPTSITIIERSSRKIKIKKCEYLYIFGFGFDPLNINQIGLDDPNRWTKQCFVTNFEDNKKNERIIVNYLTNCGATIKVRDGGNMSMSENISRLDFPIISALSVEKALDKDFSLVENVKTSEGIFVKVFGENISSYYAEYKKYLK